MSSELLSAISPDKIFKDYNTASSELKAEMVKACYGTKAKKNVYATSRDYNLRELEVDFIIKSIMKGKKASDARKLRIVDIGCGNGYTDLCIAEKVNAEITGLDFSEEMISGAEYLKKRYQGRIKGSVRFRVADVRKIDLAGGYFDFVVSERCLLNLPGWRAQCDVIRSVRRILKKGGYFIMVEGTRDGLKRLNRMRTRLGLEPIPDRASDNMSSLKFSEKKIEKFLKGYFKVVSKQYFGMYYFISRIIHPMLVYPEQPKFDARINEIAREIAMREPDFMKLGHVMGYVLKAD